MVAQQKGKAVSGKSQSRKGFKQKPIDGCEHLGDKSQGLVAFWQGLRSGLERVECNYASHVMTRSAAQGNESNEATGFSKTKLMIGENEANNNFDFS